MDRDCKNGSNPMDPIRNVIDAFFDPFEREESLIFDTFSLKKIIMMKNDPLVVDKVVIGVSYNER